MNIEIELIKGINTENEDDNFVISPIGIEIILSLCSNGAKGKTQKEILNSLKYKNIEEANETSKEIISQFRKNEDILKIANAVLTIVKANKNFIDKATKDYDSLVQELKDYHQVNMWAKEKTKNNIVKIIDSLTPNLLMILVNALYFEAFWIKQFEKKNTFDSEFHNLNGTNDTKTMMLLKDDFNFYENGTFKAIKLLYKSKTNSMHAIVILPKDNINSFINNYFNIEVYKKIIEELKKEKVKVNLILPKFELEFKTDMTENLKSLGITQAFDKQADFKGICDISNIFIGQVLQKNYINVNEEGTQASSITELEIVLECTKDKDPNAKDFIADRPFLFLIRNEDFPEGRDILFCTKFCKVDDLDDY